MFRGEPAHGYTFIEKEEKLKTQKFIRKPFEIEAVQVTPENLEEVAQWCMGDIVGDAETETRYVKVRVHHPLTDRQTKAFVGDWVLYAGKGYKVYTDKAFKKSFDSVGVNSDDPDQLSFEEVASDIAPGDSTDEQLRKKVSLERMAIQTQIYAQP